MSPGQAYDDENSRLCVVCLPSVRACAREAARLPWGYSGSGDLLSLLSGAAAGAAFIFAFLAIAFR